MRVHVVLKMLFQSAGKLIANESDEGKRQFDEAALYRAYEVWRFMPQVMKENFQIFQARICVSDIRFVSEIILATLGCSRMLLIFGTSFWTLLSFVMSTRCQWVEEDHSIHPTFSCPGVDSLFISVYFPEILFPCVKLRFSQLTNTKRLRIGI